MGYRVVYGPDIPDVYRKKSSTLRIRSWIAAGLLVFSLLVKGYWPEGCRELRTALLPEGISATQLSAEALWSDLREGTPVSEALTVFCFEVLQHSEPT